MNTVFLKLLISTSIIAGFFVILLVHGFTIALAAEPSCSTVIRSSFSLSGFPGSTVYHNHPYATPENPVVLSLTGLTPNTSFDIACVADGHTRSETTLSSDSSGRTTWNLTDNNCFSKVRDWNTFEASSVGAYFRLRATNSTGVTALCSTNPYTIENEAMGIRCEPGTSNLADGSPSGCFQPGDEIQISAQLTYINGQPYDKEVYYHLDNTVGGGLAHNVTLTENKMLEATGVVIDSGKSITLRVYKNMSKFLGSDVHQVCSYESPVPVQMFCTPEEREEEVATITEQNVVNLCARIPQTSENQKLFDECIRCMGNLNSPKQNLWTALGCFPTTASGITSSFFRLGLSLAGGFATLFILFGALTISTSAGNPEKMQTGKQMVTAAIMGLLLIIFSAILLNVIGVQILQIPGFFN